jgi:DNA helicase-2/ATP-dependent DNA helicase PcrA
MTRAMERLYLTNATLRRMHGTTRYNLPSRFLSEIPASLGIGRAERSRTPDWAASSRPPRADLGDWRPPRGAPRPDPHGGAPAEQDGLRVDYSEGQWSFEEAPPLAKGTRVEHPVFGAGRIESVQGQGPAAKAQIRFDRAGIKTVVLRYAQLRILSR